MSIIHVQQIQAQLKSLFDGLEVSGKETALPPSPPLRTVRESFDSYRSSLTNAPCGTRFLNVQMSAVDLAMAVWMQEYTVVGGV
jgi:hypothetical protein